MRKRYEDAPDDWRRIALAAYVRITRNWRYSPAFFQEMEQYCWSRVLSQSIKYYPDRSAASTYINRCVEYAIYEFRSEWKRRKAMQQKHRVALSHHFERKQADYLPPQLEIDRYEAADAIRDEVQSLIASLPGPYQETLRWIQQGKPQVDEARRIGISKQAMSLRCNTALAAMSRLLDRDPVRKNRLLEFLEAC